MKHQFITPQVHGILDYVLAVALIATPLVIDLGSPIATWMSIAGGAGLIVYSLMTGYAASVAKLIPFRVHLALDFAAGLAFAVAPFVFGFGALATWFYVAVAVTVTAVVVLSSPDPTPARAL